MECGYPDGNNNVHDIAGSDTKPPVSKTDRGFPFLRAVAGKAVHAVLSSITAWTWACVTSLLKLPTSFVRGTECSVFPHVWYDTLATRGRS